MSDTAATATTAETGVSWGWLLTGGILTVLAGIFMLVFPVAASVSVTLFAGWMLLFAGVVGFVGAITNRAEGGMWAGMLLSLLAVVAGFMLAFNPLAGTVTLTMVLVLWLLADGILGTVIALVKRGQGWGWWLASSLLSLALGLLLLGTLPVGAGFIIGTYVGIVLLFRGMMLTALAFEARRASA